MITRGGVGNDLPLDGGELLAEAMSVDDGA